MNCAISVENLQKSYKGRAVLKGVSFCVERGEIFALLGVNGAGKTTALECIEGLRKSDGGKIRVCGRTGIQLQSSSLPAHIRAVEAVRLFAARNGRRADERMLSALGVDGFAKKQYGGLSEGQKRRLHLALALVRDPDVLFLDEPTAGLDVEGRASLHGLIRALKQAGKTIVLASHDMAEVEALCDRIAVLREGKIAFVGSVPALAAAVGRRHTVRVLSERGEETRETDRLADTLLEMLGEYKRLNIGVLDVRTDRGTLEEHFLRLSGGGR